MPASPASTASCPAAPHPGMPRPPSAAPGSAGRILVVDDTYDNRSVLRRRLVKRDFAVVEAETGEEALDLVAGQRFDLVLLDVMMPGLSGIEVLTRIRQDFSSQELPVIMVTAKSFSEDVVEALQLGADDYVTKPVDFDVALARINTQIARKKAADAMARRSDEQEARRAEAEERAVRESAAKRRSEADVAYLAAHDPLTGLANRAAFCGELDRAARDGEDRAEGTFCVLFVDLDRFKAVNDAMGHLVGDELLKLVAGRLSDLLAAGDRLSRFGGDEFLVLHRITAPGSAAALGERILAALCQPFQLGEQEVSLGASIGIARQDPRRERHDVLIGEADLAMYAAKKAGGNRVRFFDDQLADDARRRTELEIELQLALKRGELVVVYQPIVNVATGAVASFEALLRWEHPRRGLIFPAEFIPIAEETGLIVQIGEWVLREACRTAASWPDEIKVAVNLSTIQFQRGNLVATVVGALAASGLSPGKLELEITESLILTQSNETIATIRRLRELGVRIAMDDFGTGYSSLACLRDFEFDKIKVDRSFVKSLEHDEGSRAIVSSISSLATNLGIATTAEGIETFEQLSFVRQTGLTEVQGYFLGRPIASESIPTAIATQVREPADPRERSAAA